MKKKLTNLLVFIFFLIFVGYLALNTDSRITPIEDGVKDGDLEAVDVYEVQKNSAKIVPYENEMDTENFKADILLPNLKNLKDESFQTKLNQQIINDIEKNANRLMKEADQRAEESIEKNDFITQYFYYTDYSVKNLYKIVSFLVFEEEFTGGASMRVVKSYNFLNQDTISFMSIDELFNTDCNYQEILNDIINKQIEEKKKEGDDFFDGDIGFSGVNKDTCFYLTNKELGIIFQKYEIAPGYMDTPEFKIPLSDIAKDMNPIYVELLKQ